VPNVAPESWAERAAERSPTVHRSKARSVVQVRTILDAAHRLIRERSDSFTTQELAKEAGVALQTFYRYFATKDELLLAVIGDMVATGAADQALAASGLPSPIDRLRSYIMSALNSLDGEDDSAAAARFIVSAHWRLQRLFPNEVADAMRPFADLLLTEINAAVEAGLLRPANPERAAWFINELVRSVYHHYAHAPEKPPTIREDLWQFCLSALGGVNPALVREDLVGGGDGQGPVEPAVELTEVGSRGDLVTLGRRRLEVPGGEDLEYALGLGLDGALLAALLAADVDEALDEVALPLGRGH